MFGENHCCNVRPLVDYGRPILDFWLSYGPNHTHTWYMVSEHRGAHTDSGKRPIAEVEFIQALYVDA